MGDIKMQINDSVKRAFMDSMESEFKREFGYDLKTIMLFADAVCKVRNENKEDVEQLKKERDKYKDRFEELKDMIYRGYFGDLEYTFEEWEKEDKENK